MAKRKPKYVVKPQPMKPEIKKRFENLLKKSEQEKSQVKIPVGELWRWDTLEDVKL